MTNITVEKIDQIIGKINENSSKKLSDEVSQQLLMDINKALGEVKKEAKEEQKEIVDKKVKELKGKISETLSDEEGWGVIKMLLNKDIKGGLNELKDEIAKSEEASLAIAVVESKPMSDVISLSLKEELVKWRMLFPNKTPEEAFDELKKTAEWLTSYQIKLEEFQKSVDKVAKESNSPSIIEVSNNARKFASEYVQLGSQVGKDSGLGLFISPAGAMLGLGGAVYQGSIEAGIYFAEKSMGTGLVALDGAAQHAEGVGKYLIETGLKTADGTAQHIEGVGKYLIETGVTVADGAAQYGVGILEGTKDFFEGLAGTRSEKDKIEYLKEKLVEREKLYENRVKELTEEKEKKDQEIEN